MNFAQKFFIKIALAGRSKTAWTIVLLAVYNGVGSVKGLVPSQYQEFVNAVLSLMAIYFRLNPSESLTNALQIVSEQK